MAFGNQSNFHCTPYYFKEKQMVPQGRCKAAQLKLYRPAHEDRSMQGQLLCSETPE